MPEGLIARLYHAVTPRPVPCAHAIRKRQRTSHQKLGRRTSSRTLWQVGKCRLVLSLGLMMQASCE